MSELRTWKDRFEDYLLEHPEDDASHDISHFRRGWRLADRLVTRLHSPPYNLMNESYFLL